ncbi:MAG: hypothetical protein ACXWMW_07785 [Syntrophales bacterium]
MNKLVVLAGVVLLALILVFSFSSSIVADDHSPQAPVVGFSVDQGDQKIPRGSVIHHLGNGTTEVRGPNGSLVAIAKASESNLVSTPSGLVAATHVFNVPSGSDIERNGNETDVYDNGGLVFKVIGTERMTAPQYSGWIEQANNWSVDNLDYFGATWVVPSSPPNSRTSAVDFLFNAIEPNTGSAIIQPVLEWNQAGSHGWTLRSWYGPDANGNYYCSSPVVARAGNSLSGVLSHSASGWSIVTRDVSTNQSTTITTGSIGTSSLAVFCALEGYSVSSNRDVPGTTTFNNMSFKSNNVNLTMTWQKYISSGTPLSRLNVEIISSSKVKLDTANK